MDHRHAFALVFVSLLLTGCPKAEVPPPVAPVPAPIVEAIPGPPVVTQSPDEIRTEMAPLEPFSPEFEDARLKLLVVLDKIRLEKGVDGFQTVPPTAGSGSQSAFVDPVTRKIAWRALTCFNPKCTGRGKGGGPLLFVQPLKNVDVGPDGELRILQGGSSAPDGVSPLPCPSCGRWEFVRAYDSPETENRRRQLMKELEGVRKAQRAARKNGTPLPERLRSGADIMKELAELPKVVLVPN